MYAAMRAREYNINNKNNNNNNNQNNNIHNILYLQNKNRKL